MDTQLRKRFEETKEDLKQKQETFLDKMGNDADLEDVYVSKLMKIQYDIFSNERGEEECIAFMMACIRYGVGGLFVYLDGSIERTIKFISKIVLQFAAVNKDSKGGV